jgi:hypothetical protein
VVAAYNASGNQSGYSARVAATTSSPPAYTGPSSAGVTANHPLSFTLTAYGNPATFTYAPLNVPAGLTVDPTTGVVNWTPPDGAVGTGYYTFSVSNGVGSTTAVVAIQVFANLPNVTYTPGGAAVATQPFGARFSQVSDPYNTAPLTYSLVTAPAGMTIDPATGLLAWTPAVSDIGNAYATVRATNYAGSRDTALTIPVAFAGPVQDVAVTHITTDSADLAWSPPAVSSEPIQGYHVTVTYTLGSGRSVTFHTLKFTTTGDATDLTMTGLPVYKTQYVSVAAYDANGRDGLAGSASFTTAYATPTVAVGGGTLTVNPAPVAPGVTTNPQSRSTRAGNSVTFTAAANGNPTPTVQWQVSTNGLGTATTSAAILTV